MTESRRNSKPYRLRSTRDFREIYREGEKIPGRYFILFVRHRSDDRLYLGVTASRKIGNAVMRNRAKRIMREAIRLTAPDINCGLDLVTVARSSMNNAGMWHVKRQIQYQLNQQKFMDQKPTV